VKERAEQENTLRVQDAVGLIWDLRIQYAGNVGVQPNTGFDVASRHLASLAKNEHLLNPAFISPFKMDSSQSHPITSQASPQSKFKNPPREMMVLVLMPVPCDGVFGLDCSIQPTRFPRQDLGVPIHHAIGRLVSLR
jgi:hypothetical protein